jgi:hypothetical protein
MSSAGGDLEVRHAGKAAEADLVPTMNDGFHVFIGAFDDPEAAGLYCQEQWEPEPDATVSDDEYSAWEARNPSWQLRSDLGIVYLDSDFIGMDFVGKIKNHRLDYFRDILADPHATERIRGMAGENENVVVLISPEAFGGFPLEKELQSTPRIKYCGWYARKP